MGKVSFKIHTYNFATNFELVQYGFIMLYEGILNNLNRDTTYDITNNRIKTFFELRVFCKYFIWPSSLYLGGFSYSDR